MEMNKLLGALGLCRRAGALVLGFDAVKDAVQTGRARLVVCMQDLSEANAKRVLALCGDECEVRTAPLTQEDLEGLVGKAVGVAAVTDENLAILCRKNLPESGN